MIETRPITCEPKLPQILWGLTRGVPSISPRLMWKWVWPFLCGVKTNKNKDESESLSSDNRSKMDRWDSMELGKETPQIYQRMGVCARRSTWMTLWAWLYLLSSYTRVTSKESVDLVYEDKTNHSPHCLILSFLISRMKIFPPSQIGNGKRTRR